MSEPSGLSRIVFAARPALAIAAEDECERALEELVRAARVDAPSVEVPAERWIRHLAERLPESGAFLEMLALVRPLDSYLACACALGDEAAMREVERRHFGAARAAVERIVGPSGADDAMQIVREKLFFSSSDAPAKIADYAGRGSLGGWVRVVAVRTALSARRTNKRSPSHESDDRLLDLPAGDHPEIAHLKDRYRGELVDAFRAALSGLTPRERNLLRLHFLDGLNIEEIGAVHQVHRATVARWIAKTREGLFDATCARLRERLGISASELQSIVALVQSQIDVSLQRFLEDDAEAVDGEAPAD